MRVSGGILGVMVLLACATGRSQSAGDAPPPRGAPQPRLIDMPPPPPDRASQTTDESERRFPILEGQARKEQAARARPAPPRGDVGVVQSSAPPPSAQDCQTLALEERMECPLNDPHAVLGITDVPRGVRVSLHPGAVKADKLQQELACQKSQVVARPSTTSACSFLDARTDAEVTRHKDRVDVDLERRQDVDTLRSQVRTALGRR
jgi:hypothetical protein